MNISCNWLKVLAPILRKVWDKEYEERRPKMKVNWNKIVSGSVASAKSKGKEANIAQAKNVLNDMACYLVTNHKPWEILEAIYRLAENQKIGK